jgi:hypothetical protein
MAVDTLKLYERLKKADLSDAASREIAEVIKEGGEQGRETLATKDDLNMATADLKGEIANLELRLLKWMVGIGVASSIFVVGTLVSLLKLLKVI